MKINFKSEVESESIKGLLIKMLLDNNSGGIKTFEEKKEKHEFFNFEKYVFKKYEENKSEKLEKFTQKFLNNYLNFETKTNCYCETIILEDGLKIITHTDVKFIDDYNKESIIEFTCYNRGFKINNK